LIADRLGLKQRSDFSGFQGGKMSSQKAVWPSLQQVTGQIGMPIQGLPVPICHEDFYDCQQITSLTAISNG
jgi:hypothetical protein